ncbi:MAG: WD40 repeat domain-containing serine/threonine protein kinase [Myxococcota bacterium]
MDDSDPFGGSAAGWSEVAPGTAPAAVPSLPGDRYRIDGLLGRGGMGEVFQAWDAHLSRHVALKRVHTGSIDAHRVARLLREARVTARLDHPGIVPVLDLGTTEDGSLFYTMRLIRGRTLTAARDALSARQVLRHFADAAQAVAFAHAHGVVHRDLKPDNIMVGAFGETQVVDWGLARALDSSDPEGAPLPSGGSGEPSAGPALTRVGDVVGTERYLSPEAARGEPMGPEADVFALGATLVELLTGKRGSSPASWRALAATITDGELAAIATRALADPASPTVPASPRDSRAVPASPRDSRYPDAGALSADLGAYFDRRPVGAYAYSAWELARRTAERWRWPLRVGGAAVLAALTGLTIAGVGVLRERDRAVAAEARERDARIDADHTLASSLAHQAVLAIREGARPEAAVLAAHALRLSDLPRARGALMAVGAAPPPRLERIESPCPDALVVGLDGWVCADAGRVWTSTGELHRGQREAVAPSLDGAWVALEEDTLHLPSPGSVGRGIGLLYTDGHRAARLIRLAVSLYDDAGAYLPTEPCREVRSHRTGAWAPEGFWVACLDGTGVRTSLDGTEHHVRFDGLHDEVHDFVWSSGTLILATGADHLEVRDDRDGHRVALLEPEVGRIRRLSASPRGRWLLVEGDHDGAVLWDLNAGRAVIRLPRTWRGAVFQRDGHLASGRTGLRLDPDSVRDPTLHARAGLSMAAIDPTGSRIAAALGDGTALVWNARTDTVEHDLVLDLEFVTKWAAFSADGAELVVANMSGPPARFDLTDGSRREPFPVVSLCRRLFRLGSEPSATWCLGYAHSAPIQLDGAIPRVEAPGAFDDGGQNGFDIAAAIDHQGRIVLVRDGPDAVVPVTQVAGATRIDITAAGDLLVVGTGEAVVLLDPDGTERGRIPIPSGMQDVAVSPDGRWLAASFIDGRIRLWRASDLELRALLEGVHNQRVVSLQFTDDLLLSAGWDARVHRWSLAPLEHDPDPSEIESLWQLSLADVVGDG